MKTSAYWSRFLLAAAILLPALATAQPDRDSPDAVRPPEGQHRPEGPRPPEAYRPPEGQRPRETYRAPEFPHSPEARRVPETHAPEAREDERRGTHEGPRFRPDAGMRERRVEPWHGDIRHFQQHDLPAWRTGRWFHGRHGDRDGWWWVVGLSWYWYPEPVYPFPDPYLPPPAEGAIPPQTGAPPYWYYCADPPGYYPYVPQCRVQWERVPVPTPPR